MFSVLTDLIVGIFDFIADVFLFRGQRSKRGHSPRSYAEDAQDIARFDLFTVTCIGLVSVGLMFLLKFVFAFSTGWSVGVGIAVGTIWGVWRYMKMVNEA